MGTFAIKDDFYLNGERFKLISGSIHYFRVPPDYWRDRLVKAQEHGLQYGGNLYSLERA